MTDLVPSRWRRAIIALVALLPLASAAQELIPPDQAFTYQVSGAGGELVLDWSVVPGYYLYRNKLAFALEDSSAVLESPLLPRGKDHSDEFFGEQRIYDAPFQVRLPYRGSGDATLVIKSQGCSETLGICFPPQTWRTAVTLDATAPVAAGLPFGDNARSGDFLPPDEAFAPIVSRVEGNSVEIGWQIAPGYYLYKSEFRVAFAGDAIVAGAPEMPAGKAKYDEFFGDTEVYYDDVFISVPLTRSNAEAGVHTLELAYQGCAEDGICYPVIEKAFEVSLPAGISGTTPPTTAGATQASLSGAPISEQARLATLISDGNLFLVLGSFFVFGLLLAFTPCVLPMVPILSGIIAGDGDNVTPMRGFWLALLYVLGMALTYTIAGAAFAAAGQQAQTAFQQPWILISFAGLFVVLAASMFGFFTLQMPSAIQSRLASVSGNQKRGTAAGAFIMGALSSLVVTACVAPPLVAALAVIGQSGDVVRGGMALFSLSIGMGVPLLIVGASAGRLLPKAGAWMQTIKQAFGFVMLGLAIWMLARLLPGEIVLFLWAVLIFIAAVFLGALSPLTENAGGGRKLSKGFGLLAMLYGAVLFIGSLTGGEDPLQPLKGSLLEARGGAAASEAHELEFARVKTVVQLEQAIANANAEGRPVMLDFYADWCVSCKEMEKYTFTDERVLDVLSDTLLLQADVTANDDDDKALLKRFGIYGPPSIIFFGPDGQERPGYQVVGYMNAEKFAAHASAAIAPAATTAGR